MTTDLYNTVTETILAQMQAGAAPWVKPWSGKAYGSAMPRNAASYRAYSGVNVPLLWIAQEAGGYASPRWITFKQAIEAGGNVRKGEKGTAIVFVSAVEVEAEGSEPPGDQGSVFRRPCWRGRRRQDRGEEEAAGKRHSGSSKLKAWACSS